MGSSDWKLVDVGVVLCRWPDASGGNVFIALVHKSRPTKVVKNYGPNVVPLVTLIDAGIAIQVRCCEECLASQELKKAVGHIQSAAEKKGYLAKGFLQKLLPMLFFYCLVVHRERLLDSSAKRCLVQNFGWCDNGPQGAKTLNSRIGMRRLQCRGGSAVHSALQGSAENWRPNF